MNEVNYIIKCIESKSTKIIESQSKSYNGQSLNYLY